MAYCTKCGAYIPDGETVCVACGTAVSPVNTQTAEDLHKEAQSGKADLYETLRENQQKQKEQTAQWASQAGSANQSHSTSQNTGGTPTAGKPYTGAKLSYGTKSKILAVLSYVSVLCFLPFFIAKDDEFAKFHGRQGIVLLVASLIAEIVMKIIPFLRPLLRLAIAACTIIGLYNVFSNKMKELPYIGKYASKLNF